MGACYIEKYVDAISAEEAFTKAYEADAIEYGEGAYSGGITSCDFTGTVKSFEGYATKENIAAARAFIATEKEKVNKWECKAIDLGIDHFETVKTVAEENRNVIMLTYCVTSKIGQKDFPSYEEAKQYAHKIALEHATPVEIWKLYTEQPHGNRRALYSLTPVIEKTNEKPTQVPEDAIVREIHLYCLFGWAGM